jgi:hypothetical protein
MKKIIIFLTIICLFFSISFAGTIDPNVPDSKYIEYAEKFYYIGQVVINRIDDNSPYLGSAVAHKDNSIITAAHLFYKYKSGFFVINGKKIKLNKVVVHKDYEYNSFGQHDIAVCFLDETIGLPWYPELYSDLDEKGRICSLSGFGSTGNFLTGVKEKGGIKRAGSNIIDTVDPFMVFCSTYNSDKQTSLEFLIAPGDSGGGLFIGNRLAGIHSCTIENREDKGKSKYGTISAHTRVSIYKEWIENTIAEMENKND